ncbi:MAG: hypothetical protein U5L08_01515 [Xanthomonadales bacterium]|nr:hypothetical protein [Xanthomonadales bacterium]
MKAPWSSQLGLMGALIDVDRGRHQKVAAELSDQVWILLGPEIVELRSALYDIEVHTADERRAFDGFHGQEQVGFRLEQGLRQKVKSATSSKRSICIDQVGPVGVVGSGASVTLTRRLVGKEHEHAQNDESLHGGLSVVEGFRGGGEDCS